MRVSTILLLSAVEAARVSWTGFPSYGSEWGKKRTSANTAWDKGE